MVRELRIRAAKASLKDFQTATFIPNIARDRKNAVDKMLMAYKKLNNDFCFIVRNNEMDIKVLIKCFSGGSNLPYRKLSLEVFWAISPIKTRTKPNPEEAAGESPQRETNEEFLSPSRRGGRDN